MAGPTSDKFTYRTYTAGERSDIVNDEDQILDLLKECELKFTKRYSETLESAGLNERTMIAKHTTQQYKPKLSLNADLDDDKIPQNIEAQIVYTFASLIMKDRPGAYAVPIGAELEDKAASEIVTKLIEYLETELFTNEKLHNSAIYCTQHGTGAMKCIYNPATDKIEWKLLSIFDFYVDDVYDLSTAQYVVTRDMLTEWRAKELLASVAGEDEDEADVSMETYRDGDGKWIEGCPKYEIWYKPCFRYPKGLYACIINNKVVEAMDYPYVFSSKDGGEEALLPVIFWKLKNVRACALGSTWLNDVTPIQLQLNLLNTKIHKRVSLSQQWLLVPKALAADGLDEDNLMISFDDAVASQTENIRYVSPAPIDSQLYGHRDFLVKSAYTCAGINESTTGNVSASQSGRALAYAAELDSNKHSDSVKSLENFILGLWTMTVKLMQKYYEVERQIMIGGEQAMAFSAADIQGVDVRLESRSANNSTQINKDKLAREDAAAGIMDPVQFGTRTNSTDSYIGSKHAKMILDKLIAGEEVNITPETMNPDQFLAVIQERLQLAYLNKDMELVKALMDLQQNYVMMLKSGPEVPETEPTAAPTQEGVPAQPLPESTAQSGAAVPGMQ